MKPFAMALVSATLLVSGIGLAWADCPTPPGLSGCKACHVLEPGKASRVTGPNLVGVVGQPAMHAADFKGYSEAMKAAQAKGDLVRASWGPFNALDTGDAPEITGVTGEVAWSDSMQTGVMKFTGLPPCKSGEQYQLWIVDAERGISQRVSGAVFGCSGRGPLEVPIEPQLPIAKAAAFAVTLEREGGVVVSDMKRRVVLAAIAR